MEEWVINHVKECREEQRNMFGTVGAKKDCKYYFINDWGEDFCRILVPHYAHHKRRECLQCEAEVCYFYSPIKEEGDSND